MAARKPYQGPDRRNPGRDSNYTGPERRRQRSVQERREEWQLLREQIMTAVGVIGITVLMIAFGVAVVLDAKLSPFVVPVAIGLLTIFGGILGVSRSMVIDELRRQRRDTNGP